MYKLENNRLKVDIAAPGEKYDRSRFDWTGFITQVTLDDEITFMVPERQDKNKGTGGFGLSNEFGIDRPVDYDEVKPDETFLKIGVGLLTKPDDKPYDFVYQYDVTPAEVMVTQADNELVLQSTATNHTGYGYELIKKISLVENELVISYALKNIGSRLVKTNEYSHNFIGINDEVVGRNYQLTVPALTQFNLELGVMDVEGHKITWPITPDDDFYGTISVEQVPSEYHWDLYHMSVGAGIRELAMFPLSKMVFWGHDRVISAEAFIDIEIVPGEIKKWERRYQFYR